jgi:hypothetical protein
MATKTKSAVHLGRLRQRSVSAEERTRTAVNLNRARARYRTIRVSSDFLRRVVTMATGGGA